MAVSFQDRRKLPVLRPLPELAVVELVADILGRDETDRGGVCSMSTTDLGLEVRRQLRRYIAGQLTLGDFATWLAPVALCVFEAEHTPTEDLVAEIQLRLAEYTSGHWTEEDLRRLLRPVTATYTAWLSPPPPVSFVSGTASLTQPATLSYSGLVVDKVPAAVPG